METELSCLATNGRNGAACALNESVNGNGSSVANGHPDATELDGLLPVQVPSGNGTSAAHAHDVEAQNTARDDHPPVHDSAVRRIKKELNDVVCWRVRLWMVFVLLLLAIIAVVLISLALCSAIHEDEDEKFDRSLFKAARFFNGSFHMPNMVFTEELFTLSSNESQALAADLQNKLDDLYRSSTALGRYFSRADIKDFRNGSVVVDYELTFHLPAAEQEQLGRFVVSRELVYNVFRQFLYDQETAESATAYIDPLSLTMLARHW